MSWKNILVCDGCGQEIVLGIYDNPDDYGFGYKHYHKECFRNKTGLDIKRGQAEEIARLKEARRWRKYPDEVPSKDGEYLTIHIGNGECIDYWFFDGFRSGYSGMITHWLPLPPDPEQPND